MPRKPSDLQVSIDQSIKELLQLHPDDTLAFLLPDVVQTRGKPISWQCHNIQVRKKDLTRKGMVMDLNIEYTFAQGQPLLLVLVEHWSTARSIDLVRTAQYYLDLTGRFPSMEVVPVALITEIEDAPLVRAIHESPLQGGGLMAMAGRLPRAKRLSAQLEFFVHYDEEETRLLFPLFTQVGKFTVEEHAMTIKYLTQLPKPLFMTMLEEQSEARGMERGIERGARASKLEAAAKMREHGISWEIVTSSTGIKPEDLEAAQ